MLLAQDPANRVPETWEVMHPAPIEGTEDKRIRRAARELAWMERLAPGFRVMHPLAPRLPQECIAIDSHTLQGYEFQTTHDVPGYQRWFEQRDKHAVYRHHKRFLQYLQWQRPRLHKAHWVLKAPAHLFGLAELLAVYPDAGIVQTHRNPLKVMASLASLSTMLRAAFSESVDPRAVGREMARRWGGGLLGALEQRDSGRLPAERFLDIDYRAIVEDPIDTVKTIYARFDRELTPTAERAMRAFLAANPKDKHGAHRYSLEQFGLDADEQDRRFAAYRITRDAVECKPHQPHYQSRDYNPLNGDIERWFEPIRPEIAEHPALRDLMDICRSVFNFPDDLARATPWHAEAHQFRIEARADTTGLPTPEGMHRDGVDWVCVVLVNCKNVESGTTEIYDSRRDVTNRFTLVEALDTVFLDDIRVRHGVTPILPKDPALPSHRDVLVLTFRKDSS